MDVGNKYTNPGRRKDNVSSRSCFEQSCVLASLTKSSWKYSDTRNLNYVGSGGWKKMGQMNFTKHSPSGALQVLVLMKSRKLRCLYP